MPEAQIWKVPFIPPPLPYEVNYMSHFPYNKDCNADINIYGLIISIPSSVSQLYIFLEEVYLLGYIVFFSPSSPAFSLHLFWTIQQAFVQMIEVGGLVC